MSKAFTKESDDDGAFDLPDREISSFPNIVTVEGLAAIEAEIDRHSSAHAEALAADDKDAAARAARELRYWTSRRNTAKVQPQPAGSDVVAFGSAVNIVREDGRRQSWRIVGEDEADPTDGKISHTSPLARAMLGKEIGEEFEIGDSDARVVAISI